ncbi:vitamin K epoxide reductase family protein [Kocuria coralli]|uniref:Vitamin K epoxide reductase family protein n=1 Tax=Kocuria coralli TaxID=1461025 RepID=A0A5J5KX78_9MICC|nr:vitamin K epoxide reductase family protein [Kocuria coralli]KAA9394102.1 vitamin K epoxide reductase family protein [Kocuria coralli]
MKNAAPSPVRDPREDSAPTAPLPRGDLSWAAVAIVTAALGLFASISLVVEKWAILEDPLHVTSCDFNAALSCGTVIRSAQANLFAFPNPFIGLVGYTLVIVLAVGVLAGARYRAWFWQGLLAGLALGEVFLIWLWTQATFEINALCLYCMLVWLMHPILLLATAARCVRTGALPAPPGLRATTRLWAPAVVVLIWLVVFGSVLVRFSGSLFGA